MSTSETDKHHFMVYAPDHTDPEAFERRVKARPVHLQRIASLRSTGVLSACRRRVLFVGSRDTDGFRVTRTEVLGPTLTPESVLPGAEQKMNGSLLVAETSTIEEARKLVEDDPYYANNVVSLLSSRFDRHIVLT
jgi:uncharacterized protein YciI